MTDFFVFSAFCLKLTIASLWCFGVFKLFDDIFLPVRARVEEKIGKWSKPIMTCPPCMGSLHGLLWGMYFFEWSWVIFPFCVCLCGLNYIVNSMIPDYE